jgi:single-stranded-DNA-specific exonuclease
MNEVKDGVVPEFGGHMMAGGFVVSDEGIHDLQEELNKGYEKVGGGDVIQTDIDMKLDIKTVNWNLFNEIEKISPFGIGNERPVFLFENVEISKVEFFGKTKEHLKLIFGNLSAIKFFAADSEKFKGLKDGQSVNLVASLEKSTFGRYPELRLRVVDLI